MKIKRFSNEGVAKISDPEANTRPKENLIYGLATEYEVA
jgi:hypothetical protein